MKKVTVEHVVCIGFEFLANRFTRLRERHSAFICPVGSIVWELEVAKGVAG